MNEIAFERNHQALKRLLALLYVYIGLADDTGEALRSFSSKRAVGDAGSAGAAGSSRTHGDGRSDGLARVLRALAEPMTVSRRLHRMIWKLLRPVESATRYLIVALAGTLPTPTLKPSELAPRHASEPGAASPPTPLGMPGDASTPTEPRLPGLVLLDPLKLKILVRDANEPFAPFDRACFHADPEKANEQVSDAGLMRRIAALAAALDDLPRQARRLARWKARRDAAGAQNGESRDAAGAQNGESRDAAGAQNGESRDSLQKQGRPHRFSPLKPGRAPGAPPYRLPKSRWREEHHVLAETRHLAWHALTYPDTS